MKLLAVLKCLSNCTSDSWDIADRVYECPHCGSLLDIVHPLEQLKSQSRLFWKNNFKARRLSFEQNDQSGVWRYREFVIPQLRSSDIVTLGEGNSPCVTTAGLKDYFKIDDIVIKLCGNNYTGSFKDLGMTVLVSVVRHAINAGKNIQAVGCASTGDTSAALAAYSAAAQVPSVILLPKNKISKAQLIQPIASGANVIALDTDFDGCMEIIQRLADSGIIYLANSKNALRIEGQKTIAFELFEQLDDKAPDWIVIPSGNLGNSYAIYKGFKLLFELGMIKKLPRLLLAQAEQANPLYLAYKNKLNTIEPVKAKSTLATAIQIGNPVSAKRALLALKETNGIVEQVSEQGLCDAAASIDKLGLYVCPHTAIALSAAKAAREKDIIRQSDSVVVISTANALKFTEFKVNYHTEKIKDINHSYTGSLTELPADYDKILKHIEKK